ncbi:hypothetical protein ACOME3_006143 [Neoechinorhynchus agilis]
MRFDGFSYDQTDDSLMLVLRFPSKMKKLSADILDKVEIDFSESDLLVAIDKYFGRFKMKTSKTIEHHHPSHFLSYDFLNEEPQYKLTSRNEIQIFFSKVIKGVNLDIIEHLTIDDDEIIEENVLNGGYTYGFMNSYSGYFKCTESINIINPDMKSPFARRWKRMMDETFDEDHYFADLLENGNEGVGWNVEVDFVDTESIDDIKDKSNNGVLPKVDWKTESHYLVLFDILFA